MARFVWKGDEVRRRVAAAAAVGIEQTMADCVKDAAADHPPYPPASRPYERYANRTGFNTGSLWLGPAEVEGTRVSGKWGDSSNYALFLEVGTSRVGPTAGERVEAADGNMDAIAPPRFAEGESGVGWGGFNQPPDPSRERTGPLMAPRPYLRPAADRHYRTLAERIGVAFRSGA